MTPKPPHRLYIQPAVFAEVDGVTAGFSRRTGGVSDSPYRSLNLGLSTGDDPERVRQNRGRLFESAAISPERLAIAGQVHGSDVRVVTGPGLYPGHDGLVTAVADLSLCITAADCAVVLLADPEARVVGACHSGWRGTVAGILRETVRQMTAVGARSTRLRAYISPCISVDHFEVGPEVAARFSPEHVVNRRDWPKPHVDLKAALAAQLEEEGVEALEVSPHCTFADTDSYFSYRAQNGTTGRMMGFIRLDP